jgi:transcription initiation factor TFIID subunit 11
MGNVDDEDDDDDEDEGGAAGGGRMPLYEGGQMSAAEYETDNKQKAMFRQYMDMVDRQPLSAPGRDGLTTRDMRERYDAYNRSKLKTADVRRLVNQTLSQSVPANVVTVVSAYTKTFAGLLIEEARTVQAEWMAVGEKRADGVGNPAYNRLKRAQEKTTGAQNGDQSAENEVEAQGSSQKNGEVKVEPISSPAEQEPQTNGHDEENSIYPGGAGGLSSSIEECDRGPLLPDHLREALRRYKKSQNSVGFTGLSLEGREVAAARMGGRRLFR